MSNILKDFSNMDILGDIMLVWLLLAGMIGLRGIYLNSKLRRLVRRKYPEADLWFVGTFIKYEEKKGTCDPEFSHLRRAVFRALIASFLMGLVWIFAFFVIAIVITR
jgi:hypothetical protein